MKTIVKIIVALVVATAMACVLIAHGASTRVVAFTYLFVGVSMTMALGVYDVPAKKRGIRRTTIRDKQRYTNAA